MTVLECPPNTHGIAVLDALAELEGEWAMASCVRDGEPVPQGYVRFGKRVAKGNVKR